MIVDKACFERGCACHEPRDGGGVEVIKKEWQGLTDEEITETLKAFGLGERAALARAIEAKLKEKNS